jgi:class 3 adenylate cyclase
VAGLRQLHKADQVGQGYTVVGFGAQSVPQILGLALALHDASQQPPAPPGGPGGPGGPRWRVRVGVARGSVVTGGLGAQQRRCHFFGGAVAEAVRLARECPAGETRVQHGLTRAEGAQAFAFSQPPAPGQPRGAAVAAGAERRRRAPGPVRLLGRRAIVMGL